jgi:DNA-binding protein HU-beta
MKKKDLVAAIAEATGLSKKDSEKAVEAFLETVKNEIKAGNKVSLLGFGNFEPKTNSARKGINPSTKETIDIKESKSVKFKVGKAFKDSLN